MPLPVYATSSQNGEKRCATLITQGTTVDRLIFFSHEKILTAYRENHPYNVVVLFEENVVFLFSLRQSQAPPKGQQESLQDWGIAQEKALRSLPYSSCFHEIHITGYRKKVIHLNSYTPSSSSAL